MELGPQTGSKRDYVVIGTLTEDIDKSGNIHMGGTASYAALTANAVGLDVGVLTVATADTDLSQLADVEVVRQDTAKNSRFENVYTENGRIQYLYAQADKIDIAKMPSAWKSAPIMHVGPLVYEIDPAQIALLRGENTLIGLTPQGWMRNWDDTGRIEPVEWDDAFNTLPQVDATVISAEDVGHDWDYVESWVPHCKILAVTMGRGGVVVFYNGERREIPAPVVIEEDATGAGDVFASAYFSHLGRYKNPWQAAEFANYVAAHFITKAGFRGWPADSANRLMANG